MIKIALVICASFMLYASTAAAQKTSPCNDDRKLCAGIAPGGDSVRNCFREHIHELSSTCVLALIKLSRVDPTCKTRLNRECANVKPGEGRLAACLRSAVAKLDDSCKNAFGRAILGKR